MELKPLNKRPEIEQNKRLYAKFIKLEALILELRKKEIPNEIVQKINDFTEPVNLFSGTNGQLNKLITKAQFAIVKLIEKELKLVPKNHYRNLWLAVGMVAFGLPMGIVFGSVMDNMGLLAIGLPIGMVFGIVYGTSLDKKAKDNEHQLDLEM